ncbi:MULTISPECIES: 16S rRNA (guanine(527)-N(7))-methyltransferase RsmG [Sphingomonas]|uniref:16S rRNA (guanine(527)-N(7))-methyltransferase RsmG n=1 Tax=Sphingomonas TaxID=13687 RepID=UPI000DEF43C9|nr:MULTISPECIES: 16S rRNA (guanine(527)-N(7))-methyltransferase RsmG [Sphingomonas]
MIEQVSDAAQRDVSRETFERLERYVALLRGGNEQQNLISASTLDKIWSRHIIDCAQLLRFTPHGAIADIGSGAGLPGLVIAILSEQPITLIEPRRLRVEFLERCIADLNLPHVRVFHGKAERLSGRFDAITARAVASVDKLFAAAHHLSHPETVWVLPKGRNGENELAAAQASWQGRFRTERSITEGDAVIVVASEVSARRKGRG